MLPKSYRTENEEKYNPNQQEAHKARVLARIEQESRKATRERRYLCKNNYLCGKYSDYGYRKYWSIDFSGHTCL